jgi:Sortase domain
MHILRNLDDAIQQIRYRPFLMRKILDRSPLRAGHRDAFFRALHNFREDDEITLETLSGLYRYRVDSTTVVDSGEMRVLDNSMTQFSLL